MSASPVQCEMSTGSTSMQGFEYYTSQGPVYRCERHSDATLDPAFPDVRKSLRHIGFLIKPTFKEEEREEEYKAFTFTWIPKAMGEWRKGTKLTMPEVLQTALDSDSLGDTAKDEVRALWTKATSAKPPTRTPVLCEAGHKGAEESNEGDYQPW